MIVSSKTGIFGAPRQKIIKTIIDACERANKKNRHENVTMHVDISSEHDGREYKYVMNLSDDTPCKIMLLDNVAWNKQLEDFLNETFEYYYVPKCKESWIFGAVNFITHDIIKCDYNPYYIEISGRPGMIILTFIDIIAECTLCIYTFTKNSCAFLYEDQIFDLDNIDFARNFAIPLRLECRLIDHSKDDFIFDNVGEQLYVIGTDHVHDVEYIAKKVRHVYMDMMYTRVFVGFEDIEVAIYGDQN